MMDEGSKERLRVLLSEHFNDNLKELNDALDQYIQSEAQKISEIMYDKNKRSDEFKQQTEYCKRYCTENKATFLKQWKQKYHNDN
jgi:hypothetical protein